MSTEQIYTSVCNVINKRLFADRRDQNAGSLKHLDVGAGQGQLISRLKDRFLARETHRYKTIDSNNQVIVLKNCSKEALLGRTIVMSARKR
jgi:hypothetical protein